MHAGNLKHAPVDISAHDDATLAESLPYPARDDTGAAGEIENPLTTA
jgi:hypothetical protein